MTALSRGLTRSFPRTEYLCTKCVYSLFSTTSTSLSGHNRWSKIKHDKGAVDAKKTAQRSILSHEIAQASKLYGADPNYNPRLASILTAAKKAGFPKASMESAIARGQGKSTSGVALQKVTIEVIMPPTVSMIIEAETDNTNRTMMDLRHLIKVHEGSVTPTSYLFQKKGRVAFEKDETIGVDDVLDEAIEAGAWDIEPDDEGSIVVWTEPNMTTSVAKALQAKFALKVDSSDIIWDANEDTKSQLESGESFDKLGLFIDAVRDNPNVQGVYANVARGSSIEDGPWEDLISRLDA